MRAMLSAQATGRVGMEVGLLGRGLEGRLGELQGREAWSRVSSAPPMAGWQGGTEDARVALEGIQRRSGQLRRRRQWKRAGPGGSSTRKESGVEIDRETERQQKEGFTSSVKNPRGFGVGRGPKQSSLDSDNGGESSEGIGKEGEGGGRRKKLQKPLAKQSLQGMRRPKA